MTNDTSAPQTVILATEVSSPSSPHTGGFSEIPLDTALIGFVGVSVLMLIFFVGVVSSEVRFLTRRVFELERAIRAAASASPANEIPEPSQAGDAPPVVKELPLPTAQDEHDDGTH